MKQLKIILIILTILGLFWRLYHIEFGLPHSFHADEPEIAELAIKYTFELKDIIKNNNYYKLVPISYVYGTFPAYLLTSATIIYSKINNVLGNNFSKMDLYVYMRTLSAILSLLIAPITAFLYYKLFKDKLGTALTFFFVALNWKLIVHAHYINPDILLTLLITLSYVAAFLYFRSTKGTKFTIALGILFGLAMGTKITALIGLPLIVYLYIRKKDVLGLVALGIIILGTFALSNPFSVIFYKDFIYRMYALQFRENGLVFDSADNNIFKYLWALIYMAGPVTFLAYLFGKYKLKEFKESPDKHFHIYLLGNVLLYLLFFTLGSRRVDRWLLPILPIIFIYAAYGLSKIRNYWVISIATVTYLVFPVLLLKQFQRDTPKSASYLWMQQNSQPMALTYAVTEEGLDPLNKLPYADVLQFEVYESKNAQLSFPPKLDRYEYVILSSKPMEYYKNPIVKAKYPLYYQRWSEFEDQVQDTNKFELIQQFVLPKPNLVNLSDVYIYKRL